MFISLAELERHRIVATKSYAPGTLDYHSEDFQQATSLELGVTAELVGSEVRLRGNLKTRLRAQCDRCLTPIEIPVNRDFDVVYRQDTDAVGERNDEIGVPRDELE
ncbi:MAG: YceD family protein, partial [Deltaproteobacteria bacterium]